MNFSESGSRQRSMDTVDRRRRSSRRRKNSIFKINYNSKADSPGLSRLNLYTVYSRDDANRVPETHEITWTTGIFDFISVELYDGSSIVTWTTIDLHIQPETVMGTGALLPTGGIQPYGKVLGITDVGYNILDFVGDMHMPGHGREMYFDSTGCIINGTYSSNALTEPFPPLNPYFFAIFQIIKYTDVNGKNSLVIKL